MPSLREIRRKIKSVKSTQQITKAMKMVAAARSCPLEFRVGFLLPLFLASYLFAQEQAVSWFGGDYPMKSIQGKKAADFPFKIKGKNMGFVQLIPNDVAPCAGSVYLNVDGVTKKLPEHIVWIQSMGFVQISPATDSLIIHSFAPLNHGAEDEYLSWISIQTDEMIWKHRKYVPGSPEIISYSTNYGDKRYSLARQIIEQISRKRFPPPEQNEPYGGRPH